MVDAAPGQVTRILDRMAGGDDAASGELLALVYDELRRLAQSHMRRQGRGHTLQATALVHEVYLRLAAPDGARWESRAHFLAVAATAMRQILASHARAKRAAKRVGRRARVTLGDAPAPGSDVDLVALHEALERLAALDPRQGRIVELRFFAGMESVQIAHVMRLSPATVKREWRAARAWLNSELQGSPVA